MGKLWAVMVRDLLRMIRNPVTLLGSVVLPLAYLLILGNSLLGPIKGLPVAVVALDDGPETRQLVGALQAVANGPRTMVLERVDDAAAGMRALRQGELSGVIVVPPRFSADVERGMKATVGVFVDNVDASSARAIEAAVEGALPAARQPLVRYELHLGTPEVRAEEVYPRVDYDASLVPGVIVMSIFMGSMIAGAFNLVMDRFLGVHEAYLSTPLRRVHINLGLLLSGTAVTFVSSGLVLLLGLLLTGARIHGGLAGVVLTLVILFVGALGMLAMSMTLLGRANHPRVVGFMSGFLNIILFFPSGALYPVHSFPPWLRAFARVNPETHAVAALKVILFRGGDLAAASGHVLFLGGFTAVMLLVSTLAMKRTL